MLKRFKKFYLYFITLPDRLYPFSALINGKFVRGQKAYLKVLANSFKINHEGHFGYGLMFYRSAFHFIGALLFIISATLISRDFFHNDTSLYFLLTAAIFALTYQEFYLHPKKYKQITKKGIIDWMTWVVPMVMYLVLFFY
jgi:hypothetical protein